MINNENSMLVTLSVKFWSGYKHDKSASMQTITEHKMEYGSGKFNKKLLPKFVLKPIKNVINEFKTFFADNTLPYNALLGTRILPSDGFMEFNRQVIVSQNKLNTVVQQFKNEYPTSIDQAKIMLGDLFSPTDYPDIDMIEKKFAIEVNYYPVPEADRFNKNITNTQVQKLNKQLETLSTQAKFDLVLRTEKAVLTLLDTLNRPEKRIYESTVIHNIDKISDQLERLNYENDPLLIEVKKCVDENIKGLRIDYLKESASYRTKTIAKAQTVLDLVREINESNNIC